MAEVNKTGHPGGERRWKTEERDDHKDWSFIIYRDRWWEIQAIVAPIPVCYKYFKCSTKRGQLQAQSKISAYLLLAPGDLPLGSMSAANLVA